MPKNIPSPSLPDKGRKRIMRIIIEDPVLSLTDISFLEKGILALAHSFTKNGSRLYLSDEDLALPLCTHRTTVNKAVQKLVKLGYLEKRTELREGGKSYRSLSSLIPEHSSILHLCSDEIDESIVANRYSHSSKTLQCSPTIVAKRYSHSSESLHIIKSNLKDINLKEVKEIVADAPTPTCEFSLILEEPQGSEVPLESDSLKEPIEVSEAPPLPAAPPKAKKAVRPFEITDDERAKLLEYLREQAEARGLIPKLEEDRLNLIVKETSNFWANKKKADWHRTVKNRIDQLFSWNRFSDWQAEAVGPSGLTITELNARLDYIFAWLHDTPVKPAVPFKDQADEDLATLVLISMFKENYEEVIKKKNIDDKKYYYKQFRELYEQAVKNERDRNKNANE